MQILFFSIFCFLLLVGCSGDNPAKAKVDYQSAVRYLQGAGVPQDVAKAVALLQTSSEEGSADAQLALGYLYLKGKGVTQDTAKGMSLFKNAAKKGNIDAMYNVGLAYARGEVVPKDFKESFSWFEMAALQDDVGSQYNLGVMYMNGEGTVKDPLAAYAWFKFADDHGYAKAKDGMAAAKAALTSDQVKNLDREVARIAGRIKRSVQVQLTPGQQNAPL